METLSILSAMITPVVLILATGQLILTTSQRLARSVERARKLSDQIEQLAQQEKGKSTEEKNAHLYKLLFRAAHRSRKLQHTMSILYVALSIFVATSVSIGVLEAMDVLVLWIPVILGLIGATMLFYASVLLIAESRMALGAIDIEMNYLIEHFGSDYSSKSSEVKPKDIP